MTTGEFDRKMEKLFKEYTDLIEIFERTRDDDVWKKAMTRLRRYNKLWHLKRDADEMSHFQGAPNTKEEYMVRVGHLNARIAPFGLKLNLAENDWENVLQRMKEDEDKIFQELESWVRLLGMTKRELLVV